jgi:hypothetical protein
MQLRWNSHSTLQALNLTCRGSRRLALPVLFENLYLHFRLKHDTGRRMLQDLQGVGDELFCCVRILISSGYFPYNPTEDIPSLLSLLLVSLLEKLPRLLVLR